MIDLFLPWTTCSPRTSDLSRETGELKLATVSPPPDFFLLLGAPAVVLLATKHCKAANHLISSSSVGAVTRKVRLGVMILKQCS